MAKKQKQIKTIAETDFIPKKKDKIRAACYLILGIGALYLPFYWSKSVFYGADLYPFYFTGQRFWFGYFHRLGSFPLWNPYINLGTSLLYNSTWGIFYPIHYLQVIISPLLMYRFGWLFHLILLAWGLFRWCKIAGVNRETYGWIPILVTTSALINVFTVTSFYYLYGMLWSVWILSELELRHSPRFSPARLLFFWGLLISNGEPFIVFLMGIVTIAFLLEKRKWITAGLFSLLGLILALIIFGHAAVILPYTSRISGMKESLSFSFHPLRIATLFSPYVFGHPVKHTFDAASVVNDSPFAPRFLFDTIYFPLPIMLLGIIGIVQSLRQRKWIMFVLFCTGLLLAFGKWGALLILNRIPPFSFLRYPEKMICGTMILFLGFAIKSGDPVLQALKRGALAWIIIALGIIIPFCSPSHDWPVGILAVFFGFIFALYRQGIISGKGLSTAALLIGLLQNLLAFPPQRVIASSEIEKLSPTASAILERIEAESFNRFEVDPSYANIDQPHKNLIWGTNMIFSRASIFGYEGLETPFVEKVKNMLFQGTFRDSSLSQQAIPAKEVRAIIQLTNLQYLAVLTDQPIPSLMSAVKTDENIFRLEKLADNRAFLIPINPPHPLWWFSRLERWNPKANESQLTWPPRVDILNAFIGGIEHKVKAQNGIYESYQEFAELALPDSSLRRINESQIAIEFEAPSDGWIFMSQNLLPGWILTTEHGEIPLVMMNRNFLGFNVKGGKFKGTISFHPWLALYRTIIPQKSQN